MSIIKTTIYEGKSILNEILIVLDNNNIEIDNEGLFLLGIICGNAEENIRHKESRNFRYSLRPVKVRRGRKGVFKSNINQKEILAITSLGIALIDNAENNIVNIGVIVRTLKGLCPLWPFCR
jgi:hypothetical protein